MVSHVPSWSVTWDDRDYSFIIAADGNSLYICNILPRINRDMDELLWLVLQSHRLFLFAHDLTGQQRLRRLPLNRFGWRGGRMRIVRLCPAPEHDSDKLWRLPSRPRLPSHALLHGSRTVLLHCNDSEWSCFRHKDPRPT